MSQNTDQNANQNTRETAKKQLRDARQAALQASRGAGGGFMAKLREFVSKSNALDLAIGVSGGVAFADLIRSLVRDILLPPLGAILRGVDFSDFFFNVSSTPAQTLGEARAKDLPVIAYGAFLEQALRFALVALALGLLVRAMNRFKRGQEPAPLVSKECPFCASSVPVSAVRCPHCTSVLDEAGMQEIAQRLLPIA